MNLAVTPSENKAVLRLRAVPLNPDLTRKVSSCCPEAVDGYSGHVQDVTIEFGEDGELAAITIEGLTSSDMKGVYVSGIPPIRERHSCRRERRKKKAVQVSP